MQEKGVIRKARKIIERGTPFSYPVKRKPDEPTLFNVTYFDANSVIDYWLGEKNVRDHLRSGDLIVGAYGVGAKAVIFSHGHYSNVTELPLKNQEILLKMIMVFKRFNISIVNHVSTTKGNHITYGPRDFPYLRGVIKPRFEQWRYLFDYLCEGLKIDGWDPDLYPCDVIQYYKENDGLFPAICPVCKTKSWVGLRYCYTCKKETLVTIHELYEYY